MGQDRHNAELLALLHRLAPDRRVAFGVGAQTARSRARRHRRKLRRAGWRIVRRLVRRGYARRRPLAPVYLALLLYVVGAVLAAVPRASNSVTALAAIGMAVVWWRARRRVWSGRVRRHAWGVYAASVVWLEVCAAVGVGPPMPGVLAVATLLLGIPHWWRHRIRRPDGELVDPAADRRADVWIGKVACSGGALPGSMLADVEDFGRGNWRARVVLPSGKLTTNDAVAAARRIASAYSLPLASVIVELPLAGESDQAQLLMLADNPLVAKQFFTQPTYDPATGFIVVGVNADGGPALWRLHTPGSGACHGYIFGTTGSGKSGLVNVLCTEIRHSGRMVLWLGDPEDGGSVGDWQEHADWFAGGVPEIRRMLQGAERVMEGRKRRRGRVRWTDERGRERRGLTWFDPTRECPQLVLLIDESPEVLAAAECKRIVAKLVKRGRKWGVGIIMIAQVPSLMEMGGDTTIRAMLSSTNIAMFRTSDRLSKQMGVPGELNVNPAALPVAWPDGSSTAGLGYLVGGGSARLTPMRGRFVEDPLQWATSGVPAELELEARSDAGEDYRTWRERRDFGADDGDGEAASSGDADAVVAGGPAVETVRAGVLTYLLRRGQATTGVVARDLEVPLPTASTTLKRLAAAGLVRQVRRGLWASVEGLAEEAAAADDEAGEDELVSA